MNTARIQCANTAATGALTRALRWLWLPLLLVAVSAGHNAKASDDHAVLTQFVVDISAIDTSGADGSDNTEHNAFSAGASVVFPSAAFVPRSEPTCAPALAVTRAFAPRAPPVSLHI